MEVVVVRYIPDREVYRIDEVKIPDDPSKPPKLVNLRHVKYVRVVTSNTIIDLNKSGITHYVGIPISIEYYQKENLCIIYV